MIKHYRIYRRNKSAETQKECATLLNELFKSLTENQKTLIVPKYRENKSKLLVEEGDSEPILCIIQMIDNQPVSAIAGSIPTYANDDNIVDLAILTDPEYQGQGCATDLMNMFIDIINTSQFDDIDTIWYQPWHENNASIHIAESAGFELTEDNDGWLKYEYHK